MTELTLSKEEITENLNLAAEEIILQCMILNRRGIVQAHFDASPHVQSFKVRVMPANTVWRKGLNYPDELGSVEASGGFDDSDEDWLVQKCYSESMAKMEVFIRYLDHLIAMNKPITTDVQGDAA